ncbi:MAG: DNA repair protein RecN [Pseudomonadota bacterium]
MLRRLSIRDIVLIDAVDLDFERGLNVLTGETGAGKSILLDALGLALGARSSAGYVRPGASQGAVSAVLKIADAHPARALLMDQGFDVENDEAVLRRVVSPDGKSKAFLNGEPISVSLLRRIGGLVVEVHGQHDDRGLLNSAGHREFLDTFAEAQDLLAACRATKAAWDAAHEAETVLAQTAEAAQRDLHFLEHALEELDRLSPEPDEEARLDAERRVMKSAEHISEDVLRAAAAMGPGPEGAEERLLDALKRLQHVADKADGGLDGAIAALDRALAELGEAARQVSDAAAALSFDPARLDLVEERLFALRALARKHQKRVDELPELRGELRRKLALVEEGDAAARAAAAETQKARTAFFEAAGALHQRRLAAASRLDAAMAAELAPLKLDRAVFRTDVAELPEDQAGSDGVSRVAFTVATNPGAAPGPIDKIASGGERSRFLLALKVCLALDANAAGVAVIFDEIDRGVGGATADAVGARLLRLAGADAEQVLVVTHSPQVAAKGDYHWRIEKSDQSGGVATSVSRLDRDGRVEEIARMIAGAEVTPAAREAALSLLTGSD